MIGAAVLGMTAGALAQFDGPAPLAWRWAATARQAPLGSPVVDGNTVFVPVGARIYALDKETGNKKWQFPLVEAIDGQFTSGAVMSQGLLIAAADNKNIYAVDPVSGEGKWQHQALTSIIGKPVVSGKFLVYAMSDNTLMAVNLENGEAAWKAPYRVFDGIAGQIGAHDANVLFFTNAFELRCISVASPDKTIWRNKFTVVGYDAEPVVYGDTIYVNTGQYVAVVNAATGRSSKQTPIGEELAFSPAISPEGAMVVTREGKAIFLDTNLRPTRKVTDLGSLAVVKPSAVGKMFLVPTSNGALNLLDPKTGEVVWSYLIRPMNAGAAAAPATDPGGSMSGPKGSNNGAGAQTPQRVIAVPASGPATLAGNTLLVLARDGSLLAFDKESGVDLTAPSVRMTWPAPGDMVNGQTLEIIFKIDDEATGVNAKTLKIDINGVDMKYTFGRDGYAVIRISQLSENRSLSPGRANITVRVADWLGNATTATFGLTIDNTLKPVTRPSSADAPGNNKGGAGDRGGGPAMGGGG
jgi:outer membrane protein assembly factor BamB